MRSPRTTKILCMLLAGLTMGAGPLNAAVDCLTDNELRIVVRSVYTRSIGRVMRACATQYPQLDERARDVTTGFLTTYSEQMRANRLAANSIVLRVYGDDWEAKFEKMLTESTAMDEAHARSASREECEEEIDRLEDMADANDYVRIMGEGMPRRLYDAERLSIPRCQ
jgi:alkanesulfonate monooxygenase SsuD/methylene tetrahydromethanopterin reductase-like flavin-dependent oxidoreductase (luciferase family)